MKVYNNLFSKALGLRFSSKRNIAFVFDKEQKVVLDMWFVFFPIDVLFLDKDKRIIEIKKDFKPFSMYRSNNKVKYVVELVDKKDYKIGEKIKIPC